MDVLELVRDGEVAYSAELSDEAIEVGSSPRADLTIPDLETPCAFVVRAARGTVLYYRLEDGRASRARVLTRASPLRLDGRHALRRVTRDAVGATGSRTAPVCQLPRPDVPLVLRIGEGPDARRHRIGNRPLFVGSLPDNDIALSDVTVSGRHLRFDPEPSGLRVRDLGSRNGTWVDGVRIEVARLSSGAKLRVGRTDVHVELAARTSLAGLVAASQAFRAVLDQAERLARLTWPILVVGESGVGKEGIARVLHERSARADGPFVAINAGGLPAQLVESELFGHERGAFTGADGAHRGVLEQADGGTLFLDEIGELPLDLQSRLLRVLETWRVRRVGAEREVAVDVRLVCATHRDLPTMVRTGTFRGDLYFRIARLAIEVPPLRSRPRDIDALAHHFLEGVRHELGPRRLSAAARDRLLRHGWPGNARELRNVVCAAAASTPSDVVDALDVERAIRLLSPEPDEVGLSAARLQTIVEDHQGNLTAAARALGMPRSTLRDRLKGLHKAAERPDQRMVKPA